MMDLYHIEDFSDIIFYNKSQERAAYAEKGEISREELHEIIAHK